MNKRLRQLNFYHRLQQQRLLNSQTRLGRQNLHMQKERATLDQLLAYSAEYLGSEAVGDSSAPNDPTIGKTNEESRITPLQLNNFVGFVRRLEQAKQQQTMAVEKSQAKLNQSRSEFQNAYQSEKSSQQLLTELRQSTLRQQNKRDDADNLEAWLAYQQRDQE